MSDSDGPHLERLRVAIPLLGREVAPRFGYARRILLADLEPGRVQDRRDLDVAFLNWQQRLVLLADERVRVLLAGGFNRRFLPYAERVGLEVVWAMIGPVEPILADLCAGEPQALLQEWKAARAASGCRGRGFGRGQGCGPRWGRGPGRGRARRQQVAWPAAKVPGDLALSPTHPAGRVEGDAAGGNEGDAAAARPDAPGREPDEDE